MSSTFSTKIVNLRQQRYDVYIGRNPANQPRSKWGNPFRSRRNIYTEDGTRHRESPSRQPTSTRLQNGPHRRYRALPHIPRHPYPNWATLRPRLQRCSRQDVGMLLQAEKLPRRRDRTLLSMVPTQPTSYCRATLGVTRTTNRRTKLLTNFRAELLRIQIATHQHPRRRVLT